MAEDLAARLLRAGLVTRGQLSQALAHAPPHGGALASGLVALGVEEDAIAGYFLALGYGPLLELEDLQGADPSVVRQLGGPVAAGLLAMPIRSSPAGLVVAMIDPSDRHAIDEIRFAVRGPVLPTVGRVSDVRHAIELAWPGVPLVGSRAPTLDPVEDLLGSEDPDSPARRAKPRAHADVVFAGDYGSSSAPPDRARTKARSSPPSDLPVPLVRRKAQPGDGTFEREGRETRGYEAIAPAPGAPAPGPPGLDAPPTTAVFSRPPDPDQDPIDKAPFDEAATEAVPSTLDPVPTQPTGRRSAAPSRRAARANDLAAVDDRWSALGLGDPPLATGHRRNLSPTQDGKLTLRPRRSLDHHPRARAPDLTPLLAALRRSTSRDEIISIACHVGASVGRRAVFLALQRGVLKGCEAVGGGLTRDGVRNLWIPASSPSSFRAVLESGTCYRGLHGATAADQIFRAAIGSRGGALEVHPIVVAGRIAAVLAVDGPAGPNSERLTELAHAVGDALERAIMTKKHR
jgi:hypothetical protein